MRKTYLSLPLALGLLLAGLAIITAPARAQDLGPNLLENAGFEGGHFFQDGIDKIVVPNGWRMHWSNNERIFGGEWATTRPETVAWNSSGGVPEGEHIYWKDGVYTMKIHNTWAPMWAAMSQDVENLEVGRKYRLAVPIYIDLFEEYKDGKKIAPWREDSGKVRLGAGPTGAAWRDENAIEYSGWWTAETVDPFYQAYPTFIHDFVATQPNMTIWIEMASSYPYMNNGFFFDLPGLFATNETGAAAPPAVAPTTQGQTAAPAAVVAQAAATIVPPTPRADGSIVHVVQAGDSLWGIAIQYAETLAMAPQDALAHIQELNNNPTFINPDDEILIMAGSADVAATPEATPGEGTAAATPAEGTLSDGTPSDGATAEGSEAEATPAAEVTVEAAPDATTEFEPVGALAGTICVGAFRDANADGQRNESETLVANAAIAIARAGTTVSTYITDGETEPFCFELTEADSYQLQLYPPSGFAATTEDNWAVSIADGESYTVSFGLTDAPAAVADTTTDETAATDGTAATTDTPTAETNDGPLGNLGLVVVGVAAVLVVLAVVGVVLLRRG